MTGKEALRILSECANGEKKLLFSDSLDLERIISKRLEKLEKLERAFEILKEKGICVRHDRLYFDYEDYIKLNKEERELLEELMKNE